MGPHYNGIGLCGQDRIELPLQEVKKGEKMKEKGAICGGVMSWSDMKKGMKKYGAYFGMMSFVMPDKQYKRYFAYRKQGKEKEARRLFDKYAISQI